MSVHVHAVDVGALRIAPVARKCVNLDFSTFDIFVVSGCFFVFQGSDMVGFSLETGQKVCQLVGLVPKVQEIGQIFAQCECCLKVNTLIDLLDAGQEAIQGSLRAKIESYDRDFLCGNCNLKQCGLEKVLKIQESMFYGEKALPSLYSLYCSYNISDQNSKNQWEYNGVTEIPCKDEIQLVVYGNIPEIVYYAFPKDAIQKCQENNTFIKIYPTDRILGLHKSIWLEESLFGSQFYKSILGQHDTDLFADDLNQVQFAGKVGKQIILRCQSMLTGIFELKFTPKKYIKGNLQDIFDIKKYKTFKSYQEQYFNNLNKTQLHAKLIFYNGFSTNKNGIDLCSLFEGIPHVYNTFYAKEKILACINDKQQLVVIDNQKVLSTTYVGEDVVGVCKYQDRYLVWSNLKIYLVGAK